MWREQAIIEWSRWSDFGEWPLIMLVNLVNIWLYLLTVTTRMILLGDLYCCLLPRCEALRTCHSGFPIATLALKYVVSGKTGQPYYVTHKFFGSPSHAFTIPQRKHKPKNVSNTSFLRENLLSSCWRASVIDNSTIRSPCCGPTALKHVFNIVYMQRNELFCTWHCTDYISSTCTSIL